jgi:hypothetical protein
MAWKKVGGRFVRHKRVLETAERARRAADDRVGGHPLSLGTQALFHTCFTILFRLLCASIIPTIVVKTH